MSWKARRYRCPAAKSTWMLKNRTLSNYRSNQTTFSWVKLIFTFPLQAATNRYQLYQKNKKNRVNQCQHHWKETETVHVTSMDSLVINITLSFQTVLTIGSPRTCKTKHVTIATDTTELQPWMPTVSEPPVLNCALVHEITTIFYLDRYLHCTHMHAQAYFCMKCNMRKDSSSIVGPH